MDEHSKEVLKRLRRKALAHKMNPITKHPVSPADLLTVMEIYERELKRYDND